MEPLALSITLALHTVAKSDDHGVLVRAPLVEVKVDGQGVDVKSDNSGVALNAALGVSVRTGDSKPRRSERRCSLRGASFPLRSDCRRLA